MKAKKYLFCLISIVVLFVSVVQSAFAHSASQSGIIAKEYSYNYGGFYVGGETVGWSIDENYHAGTNTVSYKFDSTVNYGYKQIFLTEQICGMVMRCFMKATATRPEQ